ncbi:uncharacterized protein METZ01_LOCUS255698, partial [marine metagenome]
MIGKNNVLSLCFICIVVATMASAETADEKGLAIAIEADL